MSEFRGKARMTRPGKFNRSSIGDPPMKARGESPHASDERVRLDRRDFLKFGSLAAVSLVSGSAKADAVATDEDRATYSTVLPYERRIVAPGNQPAVETPNGSTLKLTKVGGVKVGHLIAEEVDHEFADRKSVV